MENSCEANFKFKCTICRVMVYLWLLYILSDMDILLCYKKLPCCYFQVVRKKKFPLERGWSGAKAAGTSAGKPDEFDGCESSKSFHSRILL